jgi:hypothetical protein
MNNKLLNQVKNFKKFLTVGELDLALKKLVGRKNIINLGKSDGGHEILCAKLGNGEKVALIFGFPHSNEPMGSLTCLSLIKIILKNKKLYNKFTWYVIPCADPDGARLNQGWFKDKFSIKNYSLNYYRSKTPIQTDWSFPVKYKDYKFEKSPKNVLALAKLIRKVKPDLVYPIHNSGFSGAYFFITKGLPNKYYDKIKEFCNYLKIPMDLGEPEVIYMKELKKPIYLDFGLEDEYNYYKENAKNPKDVLNYGNTSINYARNFNPTVFGITGEIPYLYDPRINSNYPTKRTRRENLVESNRIQRVSVNLILRILSRSDINKKSIFYDTLKYDIKEYKQDLLAIKRTLKNEEYEEQATIAEEVSTLIRTRFNLALLLGEAKRLLLESKYSPEIEKLIISTEKKIDELVKYIERNSKYRILKIKKLVQFQLGFLLLTLDYLN